MVWLYHSLLNHLLKDIWVASSFGVLQWKLLWTCVYWVLYRHVFLPVGSMPRSVISGFWMVKCIFCVLRNCQTVFQIGHTILHSRQPCRRDRVPLQLHQHWFIILAVPMCSSLFLVLSAFPNSLWCQTFFLFMCLFPICISSLVRCLLMSSCSCPNWIGCFYSWALRVLHIF